MESSKKFIRPEESEDAGWDSFLASRKVNRGLEDRSSDCLFKVFDEHSLHLFFWEKSRRS